MARFGLGFQSLDDETHAVELPVSGRLPEWLSGVLLRNGPARFEAGGTGFRHWFDGQAMVHRFAVDGGRVEYTNRYLDTPSSRAVLREGRIRYQEFATDPCRSLFARFFTPFQRTRPVNPNVNIARFGDQVVALTESPLPVEFAPGTLATVGVVDYDDRLGGQLTTAHPHQDPVTGDLVNYVTHFSRRSEYRVYRQRHDGRPRRELLGRYRVDEPAYMHSFAITSGHVVLVEFPLVVNPFRLLLSGRPFIENYRWKPERGTRFIVMDRDSGHVRAVLRGPACFAFHHINSWEDNGRLFIDLCAYRDASIIEALYLDTLRGGGALPQATPTRFSVDPEAGTVTAEELSGESLELPRIAYGQRNGRAYRYAYGVGSRDRRTDDFLNQLVKLDVGDGSTLLWREEGCYPGEPVFVTAPSGHGRRGAEDDGIVLAVVLRSATASSYLLALDARTFQELARAEVPHAVPFGFHGTFLR
ncbi:carotenoid oxygenase family protein [Streptomyces sp. TP-A0356]|uniref:carotenoid oxygenase family protein n=1 Tax=Streptomyces sp. TP-A0356 TaxID=1359208 RepID=UPI0006E40A55|nr:carotenoid oxygenase family protein [Streptomyces sp. TP-A0356]